MHNMIHLVVALQIRDPVLLLYMLIFQILEAFYFDSIRKMEHFFSFFKLSFEACSFLDCHLFFIIINTYFVYMSCHTSMIHIIIRLLVALQSNESLDCYALGSNQRTIGSIC